MTIVLRMFYDCLTFEVSSTQRDRQGESPRLARAQWDSLSQASGIAIVHTGGRGRMEFERPLFEWRRLRKKYLETRGDKDNDKAGKRIGMHVLCINDKGSFFCRTLSSVLSVGHFQRFTTG